MCKLIAIAVLSVLCASDQCLASKRLYKNGLDQMLASTHRVYVTSATSLEARDAVVALLTTWQRLIIVTTQSEADVFIDINYAQETNAGARYINVYTGTVGWSNVTLGRSHIQLTFSDRKGGTWTVADHACLSKGRLPWQEREKDAVARILEALQHGSGGQQSSHPALTTILTHAIW